MAEHFTPERRTSTTALGQSIKQTGEAVRLLKSHRNLGLAFVATAFMALLFLDNGFWQPLLVDLELPVAGIGYVAAGAALVGAMVSLIIPRLGRFGFRVLLASGIVTMMILLVPVPASEQCFRSSPCSGSVPSGPSRGWTGAAVPPTTVEQSTIYTRSAP